MCPRRGRAFSGSPPGSFPSCSATLAANTRTPLRSTRTSGAGQSPWGGVVALAGTARPDPAVALVGEEELEGELEVAVLLLGDEPGAARFAAVEDAVGVDLPLCALGRGLG